MIQEPFEICSVINVYPTTGIINVTKFTIQSKENQQLQDNTYKFYYYVKGVSLAPVNIGTQFGNPNVNIIFEYPNIPDNVEIIYIELYIDVTPQLLKSFTLFKQLTLYRESNEMANLNYNNILQTLSITNNMNDDMILDAQKSINRLETDLPRGLNSTYSKPIIIGGKNTIEFKKASCLDSVLCNGRGSCYNVEVVSFCQCNKGYTGRYCQLSDANYKTLNEYQSKLKSIINYKIVNNKNFKNPDVVSNKEIEAINLGFKTDFQNFNQLSDMDSYVTTMDLFIKNSDQGNLGKVLTQNSKQVLEIPGKMLGYLQTSIFKTKYDNLKQQIISSGNYVDPNGKYTVRYINQNVNSGNQISVSSNYSATGGRRKITRKDFKRNLQNTNSTINNTDFIITINDPSILTLTPEQNSQFKQSYQKIYSQFDSLTKTFIRGSLGNPIKINQVNTLYNYTLDNFYLTELNNLDFNNYFKDRVANGNSYFDAKQCLIDNSNKLKAEGYDYFYIAYSFDESPFYNLDTDLFDIAMSLNSFLKVYDANSNEVSLDCKNQNQIKHYIGIYPQNQDFIDKFILYPLKYQSTDPIYQSREYMPYFIFPNGTIDHTNSLDVQKNMYYRQYIVNITDYNNPNPNDKDNFKYIIEYKYLLAEVNDTGNLAAFVYFNGLTGPMGNNYYLNYNQIFQCSENFTKNACFIFLICFFAFNFPILILII